MVCEAPRVKSGGEQAALGPTTPLYLLTTDISALRAPLASRQHKILYKNESSPLRSAGSISTEAKRSEDLETTKSDWVFKQSRLRSALYWKPGLTHWSFSLNP